MPDYGLGEIDGTEVLLEVGTQRVKRFRQQLIPTTRQGADGEDYLKVGLRAPMFTVATFRDYAPGSSPNFDSNARTAERTFLDLKGTKIIYKDEHLVEWEEVLVVDIQTDVFRMPLSTGWKQPPGEAWGLRCGWTLQLTKLDPVQ